MAAWAACAITATVLLGVSLARVLRAERAVWWPGLVMFVMAGLATIVLAGDDGYWAALAMFGGVILASDVVLLKSVLASSLCTRPRPEEPA